MYFDKEKALQLLRLGSGKATAGFREGQESAIETIINGKRLLVIQKTGWGKSFVYFIATKLLREANLGPVLLISPLLSLMRNQIQAAEKMGVRAATINSDNKEMWFHIQEELLQNKIDILLISPERLGNSDFINTVLSQIADRISLLVIDEAHCISDWGHDFRPDYRRIERIIKFMPPNLRLLATTATANNRVKEDLIQVLGQDVVVSKGDLNRSSLTLQTIKMPNQAQRLAWLAEQIPKIDGSGIVYTLTIRDAEQVAQWLRFQGIKAEAYTGETENREELEEKLLYNQVKVLVATTALGMGYDKPDLAFVIHYQAPTSIVAYYQQVGRAGRALESAYGILLSGKEDKDIADYFIQSAFPTKSEVQSILGTLENNPSGLSIPDLQGKLNVSKGRIEKTIKLLSLESPAPIAKQGTKWQLTTTTLSETFWQRAERLTLLRYEEQKQMQLFVDLPFGQHMSYAIEALDGDPSDVQYPTLPPLNATVSLELEKQAVTFLRKTNLSLNPRKKWPVGGLTKYQLPSNKQIDFSAQEGRVLSVWGDAGWGTLVKNGKYRDNYFSDELVTACVEMIRNWKITDMPAWITCVPSLRHPDLVPNFAKRLAQALNLPFYDIIQITSLRPEQKTMQNSIHQARNLDGVFQIKHKPLSYPVFLVDDMVDSQWTFTICAWLLQKYGSGKVYPLALSKTGKDQ